MSHEYEAQRGVVHLTTFQGIALPGVAEPGAGVIHPLRRRVRLERLCGQRRPVC
jgi:hypothetical protein